MTSNNDSNETTYTVTVTETGRDEGTCPRCGGPLRQSPADIGALSREDNETIICGQCGLAEVVGDEAAAESMAAFAKLVPFDVEAARAELGEPEDKRVQRDGDRDLQFAGWLLGIGACGSGGNYERDWTRGTRVRIWVSAGGAFIVGAHRWSRWQGEGALYSAEVIAPDPETPSPLRLGEQWSKVLDWLSSDTGSGELGPAGKQALEDAASNWSAVAGLDVEVVS